MTVADLVKEAHAASRRKGWYRRKRGRAVPRNVLEMLALVHSEVSEATEIARKHPRRALRRRMYSGAKPVGFDSELADTVIRCADLAGYLGINLQRAVVEKMAYNETRPHRHGGKRA